LLSKVGRFFCALFFLDIVGKKNMKHYTVLLRGINVGGHKKIKMADLRLLLEKQGLSHVQTYIQSGNILCASSSSADEVESTIANAIEEKYGFVVPTMAFTVDELKAIIAKNPYHAVAEEDRKYVYFTLLDQVPAAEKVQALEEVNFLNDTVCIIGKTIYANLLSTYSTTKFSNNFIESKLKVKATTRNWRTMHKLLEMSSA